MLKKKKGIDISKWQGDIFFEKVKSAGVQFVIIRSGYGTTTDPKFFANVAAAKAAGLEIAGIYHFSYAESQANADAEGAFSRTLADMAGLPKSTAIFYDFEYDTVNRAKKHNVFLGRDECIVYADLFTSNVRLGGYRSGIYTNLDYYQNMYTPASFTNNVLWLADYSGDPDIPCAFHQYSNKGSVSGINGNVDLDYWYVEAVGENDNPADNIQYSREKVVELAKSWIGKNEADGSYKEIIDIYNSYGGSFPRGTKMRYDWPWCAATWSALAIKLGYTDIMPIEISCYQLMVAAAKAGIWVEDDSYIPAPGDGVLYCWNDDGVGDNNGMPNHVGVVEYCSDGYISVIEGNYKDAVGRRVIKVNGMYIRGFIVPKYSLAITDGPKLEQSDPKLDLADVALEVITGLWGSGEARKFALERAGYNYQEVQNLVNKFLNSDTRYNGNQEFIETNVSPLYKDYEINGSYRVTALSGLCLRDGAGTNKKKLVTMPFGTIVKCTGGYTPVGDISWFEVQVTIGLTHYTGFASSAYLDEI